MNKSHILLGACWIFFSQAIAVDAEKPEETINQETNQATQEDQANQTEKSNPDLVKAVKEALSVIKRESPQVHEDSLRVWKNFKPSSKPIHYTYRVWGRWIILWLKDEKKMTFQII